MKEKYPEEYDIMQNTPAQIFKESAIDESKDSDEVEEAEIPKSKNKDLKKLYRKNNRKNAP